MIVTADEKADNEIDPEHEEYEMLNMPSLRSVMNGTLHAIHDFGTVMCLSRLSVCLCASVVLDSNFCNP